MSEDNKFPILFSFKRKDKKDGFPKFVKISELSEKQAMQNHSQTLKRLAERGGLSPEEIVANVLEIDWVDIRNITESQVQDIVRRIAV